MNISDLYNASQANSVMAAAYARQVNSTSSVGSVESKKEKKSYDYSDIKAEQKVASAKVNISSLGNVKAAVSDTQAAAKDIQKLGANATSDEMAAAANKLASAYNNTLKVAKEGGAGNNAESDDSRRVGSRMRSDVTGSGLSTELQNAGFSVDQDGSIKIDQEKFKAAAANDPEGLRKALEKVGQKVEASSTKTLDPKGELNTSISNLEKRAAESTGKASGTSSSSTTGKPGRYVSPTEIANNTEKSIEAFNKKIKAGGPEAEKAAKEFANSDAAKELAKAGITQNSDGTLSMDREKFKSAASANGSSAGSAIDKASKPTDTNAKPTTTPTANASSSTTSSSASTTTVNNNDRSPEARKREQEKFEAALKSKYQSFARA